MVAWFAMVKVYFSIASANQIVLFCKWLSVSCFETIIFRVYDSLDEVLEQADSVESDFDCGGLVLIWLVFTSKVSYQEKRLRLRNVLDSFLLEILCTGLKLYWICSKYKLTCKQCLIKLESMSTASANNVYKKIVLFNHHSLLFQFPDNVQCQISQVCRI